MGGLAVEGHEKVDSASEEEVGEVLIGQSLKCAWLGQGWLFLGVFGFVEDLELAGGGFV